MSPIPPYSPVGGGGIEMLYGAGVPDNGIGADGDLYVDTSDDSHYKKVAGVWIEISDTASTFFNYFQSSGYAAGASVLAAGVIADGQQWNIHGLAPNGTSTWNNAIINPSSDMSALMRIEVKSPALLITPPIDSSYLLIKRVSTMTFDGQVDTDAFSFVGTYDTTLGGVYVPPMDLAINRAVGPAANTSAVITDEIQVQWAAPGDCAIVPQRDNAHGIYMASIV